MSRYIIVHLFLTTFPTHIGNLGPQKMEFQNPQPTFQQQFNYRTSKLIWEFWQLQYNCKPYKKCWYQVLLHNIREARWLAVPERMVGDWYGINCDFDLKLIIICSKYQENKKIGQPAEMVSFIKDYLGRVIRVPNSACSRSNRKPFKKNWLKATQMRA